MLNKDNRHPTGTAGEPRIEVQNRITDDFAEILTPQALEFVAALARRFAPARQRLLEYRFERRLRITQGEMPDFLPETEWVREDSWKVAPIPEDLKDRRVEITGPPDRKMVINALNSGAKVFMADFEDSCSPTWDNLIQGQINLRDAVRGTIELTTEQGKHYELNQDTATLVVRPRGWHLVDTNVLVDGEPISASLLDFGLFFFHNAEHLLASGSGPYFYLPKMENHLEARLWNQVFVAAQKALGVPLGSIRATVLIEHILAAFEMDEILYELKQHSGGLNCGRWDYIFSVIKVFSNQPRFVMPNRDQVTMESPFLRAYVEHLIQTCHRRGIHAMGGMAAQIPIKRDKEANRAALEKVEKDKVREVDAGHDGTWVAHPGLVPVALRVFERLSGPHQISNPGSDHIVTARDLLEIPSGSITETGLRHNINVALLYLESWLRGTGCVPLYDLMEDAATAEICRSQLWQWIRHGAKLKDGRLISLDLVQELMTLEIADLTTALGEARCKQEPFLKAESLLRDMITQGEFPEFLTLAAYDHLNQEAH